MGAAGIYIVIKRDTYDKRARVKLVLVILRIARTRTENYLLYTSYSIHMQYISVPYYKK